MTSATPNFAGAAILVVDDDQSIRTLLETKLIHQGYRALAVGSGQDALYTIRHHHVDLVILDIMMPEWNGFETLSRIRQEHSYSSLPVIMLSARGHGTDVITALNIGANDYAVKPVDFDVLLKRIQRHLSLRAALKSSNQPVIGGYRLVRRIGSGNMGLVFEAFDGETSQRAAVKVLPKSLTIRRDFVRRFQNEADLAARVDHPNVVNS